MGGGQGGEVKVGARCNARHIFASNILKAKTADTTRNYVKKLTPQIKWELEPFPYVPLRSILHLHSLTTHISNVRYHHCGFFFVWP